MNKHFVFPLLLVLAVVLAAPLAHSQTSNVRGVCKDLDGKPIAGAEIEWASLDNGRKFTLKTNGKGEYFSLGLIPGKYNVKLSKDGKEIFHINGVVLVSGDQPNPTDIDLKKEQATAATGQGKTPEQIKAEEEQRQKASKETNTVKALNDKITEANTEITAGDFDKAIATLNDANAMDNTRDPVWARLGDAYRMSAAKQTDPD